MKLSAVYAHVYFIIGPSGHVVGGGIRRHEENADHVLNWPDSQNGKLPEWLSVFKLEINSSL